MSSDPALLTLKYRREACEFLSSARESFQNDDEILVRLEQSLGQNALQQQKLKGPFMVEADITKTTLSLPSLDLRVPSSELHCRTCGCWLEPGRNGTTLRVRSLGRSATRRRRASRRKASELAARKQQASKGGRKWDKGDDETTTAEQAKEKQRLMNVSDGRARNAVAITCGYCKTAHKYKGMPPKKQTNRPAKQSTSKKRATEKQQQDIGKDFVSVKRVKRDKETPKADRLGDKPKKPKKKKDKSSGLLDFLSTLND